MNIIVFRLSHRLPRDERATTHVGLVGRAFGADEFVYSGQKDEKMELAIRRVVENWGGNFRVSYVEDGIKWLKQEKRNGACIVHLTMYGIPLSEYEKRLLELVEKIKVILVVGGEKVPYEIYHLADFNISITLQPHSEIAALAVILDRMMKGKELDESFDRERFGGRIKIVPQERGKKVINLFDDEK
jgi:tRNA (cytidine56-2'-O)-methyltransferase